MQKKTQKSSTQEHKNAEVQRAEEKEYAAMIAEWQQGLKSKAESDIVIPPVERFRLLGRDMVANFERNDNVKYLPVVIKVIQNAGFFLPEKDKCIEWSKKAHVWNTVQHLPFLEIEDLLYYIQTPCDGYHDFFSFLEACHRKNTLYWFHLIPNRYHKMCRAQDLFRGPKNDSTYNEVMRLYKIEFGKDIRSQLVDPAYVDCWDFEELPIEKLCREIEYALVDDNYESIVAKDIIKQVESDEEVWGRLFKHVHYLLKKGVL